MKKSMKQSPTSARRNICIQKRSIRTLDPGKHEPVRHIDVVRLPSVDVRGHLNHYRPNHLHRRTFDEGITGFCLSIGQRPASEPGMAINVCFEQIKS